MSKNKGYEQYETEFNEKTNLVEEACPIPRGVYIRQILTKQGVLDVVHTNGQRKLGPSPKWNGASPPPECEVFIGNLPLDLFEDEIFPVFSSIGEIYQIRVFTTFAGFTRGYAFVMYSNIKYANKAIVELNNYEIRPNHRIGVHRSTNNCRLCIDKLPQNLNIKDFIKSIFKMTSNANRVSVYRSRNGRITKALISYSSHSAAAMGRKQLTRNSESIIEGKKIFIEWAHPKEHLNNVFEESGIMNENGDIEEKKIFLGSQKSVNCIPENHILPKKNYCLHSEKDHLNINPSKIQHVEEFNYPRMSNNKNEFGHDETQLLRQTIVMLFDMLPDSLKSILPSIRVYDSTNHCDKNADLNENLEFYRTVEKLHHIFLEFKNSSNVI